MKNDIAEEYKEYTLGLALFDLLPVLLFLMSGTIIYAISGNLFFLAGTLLAFIGGLCKAIWKVIVVRRKTDVTILTRLFHILMPAGFALMLLSGFWRTVSLRPGWVFFAIGLLGMCLMGYLGSHMDQSARSNWIEEAVNTISQLAILAGAVMVYFGAYYHCTDAALKALETTDNVTVIVSEDYYYFDGDGTDSVLIFYPGAKVESASYAPLMQKVAKGGTDCYLCIMPLNFALFDKGMADDIKNAYEEDSIEAAGGSNAYSHWYIGGHSLGGAAAAMLMADAGKVDSGDVNTTGWDGLILLAAYPKGKLELPTLAIYGSEDEVINIGNYSASDDKGYWPDDFTEEIIEGGNHAGFGSYGEQAGDGAALISGEEQQKQTAELINSFISGHN